MKKKQWIPVLAIAACLIVGTLVYYAQPYIVGRSANLELIRRATTPSLERQLARQGLQLGQNISIRIFKETRELEVWVRNSKSYKLFKTYRVCNYSGDLGPKLAEGDRQSPEGFYSVAANQLNPNSGYHLSFNLGFPNVYDRSHGRTGSYLMIHGSCSSVGCYAMTDKGIEEIYLLAEAALKHGQSSFLVQAFPFRMTAENLQNHRGSKWFGFWQNLKQGYDHFEKELAPPIVKAVGKKYLFEKHGK